MPELVTAVNFREETGALMIAHWRFFDHGVIGPFVIHLVVVLNRNARYALNTSCNGCAVFTNE